jgi:hypothetical protein
MSAVTTASNSGIGIGSLPDLRVFWRPLENVTSNASGWSVFRNLIRPAMLE